MFGFLVWRSFCQWLPRQPQWRCRGGEKWCWSSLTWGVFHQGSVFPIMQWKSFQNIMTESPREELNLLVIFWCANEKSLLWNISFLFSIARFGGIVYCCPSCLEIFRAAQCWNAPETPSDEDSIVIFWNLISALFYEIQFSTMSMEFNFPQILSNPVFHNFNGIHFSTIYM